SAALTGVRPAPSSSSKSTNTSTSAAEVAGLDQMGSVRRSRTPLACRECELVRKRYWFCGNWAKIWGMSCRRSMTALSLLTLGALVLACSDDGSQMPPTCLTSACFDSFNDGTSESESGDGDPTGDGDGDPT